MTAAAFKLSMIAAIGAPQGEKKIFSLTVSDVNGEFALYPSGGSEIVLHGAKDVYIVDMIAAPTYGTDTTQLALFLNGTDTTIRLQNSTLQGSTVMRPVQSSPIKIPAGSMVKWKQVT